MSNKEYDGMQQLKEAELEAAKIEQEAKQARAAALAEAREQAKKEVEEYRAEKEAKFQEKKEMATGSGSQKEVEELSAETDKKIEALKVDYEQNHQKMLDLIVETVLNVNPHIPEKKKRKD